jgi:molecular chaperone IbpA
MSPAPHGDWARAPSFLHLKNFTKALESQKRRNQIFSGQSPQRDWRYPEVPGGVSNPSRFTEDLAMRNEFDFAPFYRSSIGFDRVLNLLNNSQRLQAVDAWPPYDIVKSGDNDYLITMAVAGFAEADLDITQERNVLVVKGRKEDASEGEYLHRGIAGRSFERKFELADHVRVEQAYLKNGLLNVELRREIPEAMKPRKIAIGNSTETQAPLQIAAEKKVA